jgi:RHS repeat-associated protein
VNPAAKTETVLPLAAFFQLTEKPHPGHPLPTAAPYPGITLANSNTASGLRVCLYDSGRRSRSTGKERDPETNNDFFQARYISAPQGRFTSADPLGNFVADPTNPQTWNLYSYVWNSPLALIDPSGLDPQYGPIYQSGNCSYQDVTYGEGDRATTQTIDVGCLPTGQQTSSATRPSSPKPTSPQTTGNKNVFVCASEFAAKISIAGALQRFGIGTKGASGFITDALGGNAFSGATDLISSFVSGEGGGHNVFYNMAQGLAAGPTQGFGAALGNRIEGTPWASGPSDVATAAIARVAFPLMTGAGQTLQTLNGVAELGSIGMTAGEFATGVGAVKLGYDFLTYAGGLAGCGTGLIKQD